MTYAGSILVVAAIQLACQSDSAPTKSGDQRQAVSDYASFIERLRSLNTELGNIENLSQPFLSVPGRSIELYREQLQVFEYESVDAANRESQLVDPSGSSVGTTMITWTGTPHFYRQGRVIVIYVGDNAQIIKILGEVFGSQFAGG